MLRYLHQGKDFYRNLVRLSVPLLIQNLVNQSLSLIDTFMVGRLGENELAAVTLANTPFFVMMLIVFGLQSGSCILFSQYWGKGDLTTISRVMGIGFYSAGAITFTISMAVLFFPHQIMSLTTNDPVLIEIAVQYGQIAAFSFFVNSFSLIYVGAQRSMENPKFGMYVLSVSMLVNTFLNWVLIFGNLGAPRLGVRGAAIATLIARLIELGITVIYAFRNQKFKINFPALLCPGRLIFGDFLRYSFPVVLNETLWGLGFSVYPVIIGHLDNAAAAVSAFTLSGNIERILGVSLFAVGGAASVIIGKEIGSGRAAAVYEKGMAMMLIAFGLGVGVASLLVILNISVVSPLVLPWFKLDEAASLATVMIFITAAGMPFRAVNVTGIVGILRGGGDSRMGLVLDTLPMYCFGLPLAAYLGLGLGYSVLYVYIVMNCEELIKAIFTFRRVHSKKWIKNVTRDIPDAG